MAELKQFEPIVDLDLFSLTKPICNKTIAQTGRWFFSAPHSRTIFQDLLHVQASVFVPKCTSHCFTKT